LKKDDFLKQRKILSLPTESEFTDNWDDVKPVVSILCTSHNHEKFIDFALQGILSQKTNFRFKIYIGDDNSTDHTRVKIEQYVDRYPTIIIPIYKKIDKFSEFHIACSLYKMADTKYVALCDGDDSWSDASKLQKQYDFLESNPYFVATHHSFVNMNENEIVSSQYLVAPTEEGDQFSFTGRQLLKYVDLLPSTLFFKRIPLEFPWYYRFIYNGDNFVISNLGKYGDCKYLKTIEPTIRNIHGNSLWTSITDSERNLKLAESRFWIGIYWNEDGNYELGKYYIKNSFQYLLNILFQDLPVIIKNSNIRYSLKIIKITKILLKLNYKIFLLIVKIMINKALRILQRCVKNEE
jgi:glycosyltransferase involved in cell wall biosynthesis